MRHALLPKQAATAALRPEREEARIGAVHGDAERQSEIALSCRRRVRHEVAERRIGNELANPLEYSGPLEQLRAERSRRAVVGRDEMEAPARVARDDADEQSQVVLDDRRRDRQRRDVDHLQPGLPEQQQEEEEALLMCLDDRARRGRVRRDRRDDHDRFTRRVEPHDAPDGLEPLLKENEPFVSLVFAQFGQSRRDGLAHGAVLTAFSPRTL